MPLFFYAIVRIARALVSTLTLVCRPRLMRQLPWAYFGRLVRTSARTKSAVWLLAASTVLLAIGIAQPPILIWCIVVGLISILLSYMWDRRELKRG
jgi:cobalamin synthase